MSKQVWLALRMRPYRTVSFWEKFLFKKNIKDGSIGYALVFPTKKQAETESMGMGVFKIILF